MATRNTIRVTRIEASQRQLNTALELWFSDGDPVSILTLAASAHQIVHDLNRRKKGPKLLFDSSTIKPEQKKVTIALLKREMNFFKHADLRKTRPTDSIVFDTTVRSETFFYITIQGLLILGAKPSAIETAFMVWMRIHRSDWLGSFWTKGIPNSIPVEIAEQIGNLDRAEFLKCILDSRSQQ